MLSLISVHVTIVTRLDAMRNFVCFFLILLLMWHWGHQDHLEYYLYWPPAPTPGVLAPAEPIQTSLSTGEAAPWSFKGYTITPLARYQIRARLLHRESYTDEWNGEISPIDFALGWGRMSDPTVYQKLDIGQGVRWYSYHYSDVPPIPVEEIDTHSKNAHLIPASDELRDRLFYFQPGDVVQLNGYLVQVDGPNCNHWTSSLSDTATGDHSCKVMWVNEATKVER
jgi:hypothetical protein